MAQIIRERFSKPADEFAAKVVASIDADANLVAQDIQGSIAHAKMLGRQGEDFVERWMVGHHERCQEFGKGRSATPLVVGQDFEGKRLSQ